MTSIRQILFCAALLWTCCLASPAQNVQHYVFFDRERSRIAEPAFLETAALVGAQLKYTWRELEPERGRYDFRSITGDLRLLTAKRKKLFIQLQDVSFDKSIVNVPAYLVGDPEYHGGAVQHYEIPGDDDAHAVAGGWVARRWDPAVQERFHALLSAMGAAFDGKIEGINLPETAISFGASGKLFPEGFTFEGYRDAVLQNMAVLKRAFPKSVAMQYANFMPGEWRPGDDHGYLVAVYDRAKQLGVAVGGPDLLPKRRPQLNHSYPLIRAASGRVPTGIAVQWGNYDQAPIPQLIEFAAQNLKVNYIFWSTQEPFYSQQLIPLLRRQK